MIRKALTILILVPLAVVLVALAVANRGPVTISLDPINTSDPVYSVQVPLFLLVFLLVIVGVLIGGIAAWLKQARWRRRARRLRAELRRSRDEVADLKRRAAESAAIVTGAAAGFGQDRNREATVWPLRRALPPAA